MNQAATTRARVSRPRAEAPRRANAALLDEALAPIRADLDAVTERLFSELADPVARRVVYLVGAGGKRVRPALVLLAGASGGAPSRPALVDAATAVELIHTATLIHDDIIDQSPLRRSQPAFHSRWGTERAVLMGDYLYATAFTLLARLGAPAVMQVMADVCRQLCRGELREVEARYRDDLTEAEYLEIIRDKTASLIGGSCECGALLGGCPGALVERLADFGVKFGLAFQIIDDCLDLTGDQRELGKAIFTDLDKGALSLPIIYHLQTLSRSERRRLLIPLRRGRTPRVFRARMARAAAASGAIARARARADALIREAEQALAGVPIDGLAFAYRRLARYAVSRSR